MSHQTVTEVLESPCDVPPPRQLLVVDDDPGQTEVLAYRFRKMGFLVTEAHNAADGIRLAQEKHPDLILLDIEMPGDNGLEACRRLKEDPVTYDIPVILLSASEREELIRQARFAGSQFFLAKPYDPNALLAVVQAALQDTTQW